MYFSTQREVKGKRPQRAFRSVVETRRGFHNKVRRSQTSHHIRDQTRAIESKGIIKLSSLRVGSLDNGSSSIMKFSAYLVSLR